MIPILENALPNMLSLHTSIFHLTQVKWIFKEYSKAISSHVHRAKKSCTWAELYCIRGGGRQTSVETDDGWKYTEQLDDVRNVSGCCHFRYHQSQFRHNIILYVTGRKISVWWFIIQQGRWTQYSNNISSFFFFQHSINGHFLNQSILSPVVITLALNNHAVYIIYII